MDIRPASPKRSSDLNSPAPLEPDVVETKSPTPKRPVSPKTLLIAGCGIFALVVVLIVGWYFWALGARTTSDKAVEARIIVSSGDTANDIAHKLQAHGLIRSASAMVLYTEFTHTKSALQAGGYRFSSADNVKEIVAHLVSGKTDEYTVTILSGTTLSEISQLLQKDGYAKSDIDAAFAAHYDSPLLSDKPATASLEGYLYPDSYQVTAEESLSDLFDQIFSLYYSKLQAHGWLEAFKSHQLSIYQALTLASIVQKETAVASDQAQVAQVFYRRLAQGVPLGSDVTFIYAAKQLGVAPTPELDSPYNTRIYKGLPPGPIGNADDSALQAVAHPAAGDYNYFVAGDDGKTYFARTLEEHNANVATYCKILCKQ